MPRQLVPTVRDTVVLGGVHVDGDPVEGGHGAQLLVLDPFGQVVRLRQGEVGGGPGLGVAVPPVPGPPGPDRLHRHHAGHGLGGGAHGVQHAGLDAVNEPTHHDDGRVTQRPRDGHGDGQTGDRVGAGNPSQTPITPSTTVIEVNPSAQRAGPRR